MLTRCLGAIVTSQIQKRAEIEYYIAPLQVVANPATTIDGAFRNRVLSICAPLW